MLGTVGEKVSFVWGTCISISWRSLLGFGMGMGMRDDGTDWTQAKALLVLDLKRSIFRVLVCNRNDWLVSSIFSSSY